jgi:hypothetical protein
VVLVLLDVRGVVGERRAHLAGLGAVRVSLHEAEVQIARDLDVEPDRDGGREELLGVLALASALEERGGVVEAGVRRLDADVDGLGLVAGDHVDHAELGAGGGRTGRTSRARLASRASRASVAARAGRAGRASRASRASVARARRPAGASRSARGACRAGVASRAARCRGVADGRLGRASREDEQSAETDQPKEMRRTHGTSGEETRQREGLLPQVTWCLVARLIRQAPDSHAPLLRITDAVPPF